MLRRYRYKVIHIINAFLLKRRVVLTPSLLGLDRSNNTNLMNYSHDYIRYQMWELVAHEIDKRGLVGNVAELGVYKGGSAKLLNKLFPDRKLYLFDTFYGFDDRDIQIELRKGYSTGKVEFEDAGVEEVLRKMQYRNNCIIKKGYFPDTVRDVTDKFVFVSIDVDLFQPTYKGLEFFYPRIVPGGYLFVHDYNHRKFKGSKEAVLKYSTEMNLNYLPIPDTAGSVVFIK